MRKRTFPCNLENLTVSQLTKFEMCKERRNTVVIGFDLGNDISQISYCRMNQSMPDTFSLVNGEEQYNIPTVMCKKQDKWFVGNEALQKVSLGEASLVEDLVLMAKNDTVALVGEEEYEPWQLFSIFIKKTLLMLGTFSNLNDMKGIAFTLQTMDSKVMETLKKAMEYLNLKNTEVFFLSRQDCFFQYMIHQPEDMWIHDVVLYDYLRDGIRTYQMQLNRKTRPVVCYIEENYFPQMKMPDIAAMKAAQKNAFFEQLDETFLEVVKKQCDGNTVSSIFLLGDIFSRDWCKDSLKYLCNGRRVFQGTNLFSKGACYGARERVMPSTLTDSYIFLSEDKIRANIGMQCNKGQEEIYLPLLNAGTNWFEARKTLDLILAKNNKLSLTITPLDGSVPRIAEITLDGLPVRGNKTNRIEFQIKMENQNIVQIEIKDKGFGQFFPSTGQVWKESFPMNN